MQGYTEAEVEQIVEQLRSIKINDKQVFISWIEDFSPIHHTVMLDTGMGIQVLELPKAEAPFDVLK